MALVAILGFLFHAIRSSPSAFESGRLLLNVLLPLLAIGGVVILFGPLTHCHDGFGGLADWHCHSLLTPEHYH
jgi:hypothetical protein